MATDRFLAMFFDEARELLQVLEAGLMELEARQGERAHLDKTFRAAHSLKGAAGMVGLAEIAEFTHGVEAVLENVRSGSLAVDPTLINVLLAARDHLAAAVEAESAGRPIQAPSPLSDQLAALLRGDAPAMTPPAPTASVGARDSSPATAHGYRILLRPNADAFRKGVDPLGILDELRELGQTRIEPNIDAAPRLDSIDPQSCFLSWTIELSTSAGPEQVREAFLFLGDPAQVVIEPLGVPDKRNGERSDSPSVPPSPPSRQASKEPAAPALKAEAAARIRIEASQLDQLVGLAGELAVLTDNLQSLAAQPWAESWAGTIESLDLVGRQLRDMALDLRMIPIEDLFNRFPRLVRDLADKCGKQINLRIEGEDTRLDRTIVDRLGEPLIHLLRNAIDHGLELPEAREAAGKSRAGQITIQAGHEGDRVAIRIKDDGRGLDRERIVRKAIRNGLVPPDTSPDDPRVVDLIFEAGFSTRDEVSDLSGRGVGLDVVRDTIRSLRGGLAVESTLRQGTTFLLHLPLTLALIDGLLVGTAEKRYVVPLAQVEECVAIQPEAHGPRGRSYVVVREEMVPVVSLRELFGVHAAAPARQELLLARRAGHRVGVAVDAILGRVQTVIQPLGAELASLGTFSGSTILGDGSVCLILDLATIVSQSLRDQQTLHAQRAAASPRDALH